MTHINSVGLPWTRDRSVAEASTCTTHNIHKKKISMLLTGFESAIPAIDPPQTYALDGAGTVLCRKIMSE
jgi:hypothetical protein